MFVRWVLAIIILIAILVVYCVVERKRRVKKYSLESDQRRLDKAIADRYISYILVRPVFDEETHQHMLECTIRWWVHRGKELEMKAWAVFGSPNAGHIRNCPRKLEWIEPYLKNTDSLVELIKPVLKQIPQIGKLCTVSIVREEIDREGTVFGTWLMLYDRVGFADLSTLFFKGKRYVFK